MSATDDVRDRIDGDRLGTHHAPIRDPAENFEMRADDPHDPEQWTIVEQDIDNFYARERWITVTNEELICSLEGKR